MTLVNYKVSEKSGFDTRKYRVRFSDGEEAEIVRIERPEKMIYCVSCMSGCPVGCGFCSSGIRYGRRLTADEMTELFDTARRDTRQAASGLPSFVSMMGSGEPLLNATEVCRFLWTAGAFRCAVSTSGVGLENIPAFSLVPRLKMQVSVHTVNDELRKLMIPGTPPLEHIVKWVMKIWPPERVEWNFVFWHELNDSEAASSQIAIWARGYGIEKIKVNAARGDLIPPSRRTQQIINELRAFGLEVEFYETDGEDIQAGCGQLF